MSERPNMMLLHDILEACDKILLYTNDVKFDEFSANRDEE